MPITVIAIICRFRGLVDRDGDLYTVIWDKRLLLKRDLLHEQMDYTPITPFRAKLPIRVDDTKQVRVVKLVLSSALIYVHTT